MQTVTSREGAQASLVPRLRPGAEVIEVSAEKLHIALPNHTTTFTSSRVVAIVRTLVAGLSACSDLDDLVRNSATLAGCEPGTVKYVFQMMVNSGCVYWSDLGQDTDLANPLLEYFAAAGRIPSEVVLGLAKVRVLSVVPDLLADSLQHIFKAAGLSTDIVALSPGALVRGVEVDISKRLNHDLIVCWGFPYRSSTASLINRIGMSGTRVLFGSCHGEVGRVGPYVIPGVSACLECLNARLLANSGAEELSCFRALRLNNSVNVGNAGCAHPAFVAAVAGFFVLELSRVVLNEPPMTLGGFIEYRADDGVAVRRTLLKAPRCADCAAAQPPTFAWNAYFPAPDVKGGKHAL